MNIKDLDKALDLLDKALEIVRFVNDPNEFIIIQRNRNQILQERKKRDGNI